MAGRARRRRDHSGTVQIVVFVALVVALLAIDHLKERETPSQARSASAIVDAYESRESDVWVEGDGHVVKVLGDDNDGSRHQRLIVEIADGHTILIAHNIDLAPRVPLAGGESISFKGEYVWNDKGGVLHWTHHDPQNRASGGWIRLNGETYR